MMDMTLFSRYDNDLAMRRRKIMWVYYLLTILKVVIFVYSVVCIDSEQGVALLVGKLLKKKSAEFIF